MIILEKEVLMNNSEELLKLIKEYPDLPVIPMVWYEIVADDCCSYWLGSFRNCSVGEYACYNSHVYTDREELEEEYYDRHDEEYNNMSDEEIEADIKTKTENLWIKAIIVWIDLPEN